MPSRHASAAKKKAAANPMERKFNVGMLAFAKEIAKRHPGMIALFRMKESYDAIGTDADAVAKVLDLPCWKDGDGPKYVTFPADDLEKNLALLVKAGKRVAVCEPKDAMPSRFAEPGGDVETEQEPKADNAPPPEVSGEAGPVVKLVRLEDITADASLNPRHELDADTIEDYAGVYRADPKRMPRPVLFDDGGSTYWLSSGFHRIAGAADAGLTEIECEVRKGTRSDAVIFGAAANKTNGKRMTPADKRRAVENVLRVSPEWSNRRIAEHIDVGDDLVGDVRRTIFPDAAKGKVIGKDGKRQSAKKTEKQKTWRDLGFDDAFEVGYQVSAEVTAALRAAGVHTCGELAEALKAGKTFNLKLIEVDSLMEAIEIMSADDDEPVDFGRPESEDSPEDEQTTLTWSAPAATPEPAADPEPSAEPPSPSLFTPPSAPATAPATAAPAGPVFNAAGNWKWTEASSKAELDAELFVTDGVITGTIGQGTVDKGPPDGHFRTGTVNGNAIDFDCTRQDKVTGLYITHRYQGKLIDADHISGTIVHDVDGAMDGPTKERWDARRLLERVARDSLGRELPKHLKPIFGKESAGKLIEAVRLLGNGAQALKFQDADPFVGGYLKTRPHLAAEPKALAAFVRRNLVPYCVCPICDGDGDSGQCPTCGGKGWLSRRTFDEASEPARERARKLGLGEARNDDADEDAADIAATRFIPAGPGLDPTGHEIPPALRDLFAADWLQDEVRRLERLSQMLRGSTSWLTWLKPEAHETVDALIRHVRDAIPFAVCRQCGGSAKGCGACRTSGYIPKYEHENLEAQKRQHRSDTRPDTKKNKSK